MSDETIYVALVNEGTDVWAPIKGARLSEGRFRVLGPMPSDQEWALRPGMIVVGQPTEFAEGTMGIVAVSVPG